MADQSMNRLQSFASLTWYDNVIEFLFRFVAKTSEPLLAAGIVYSAADVLSKGHLGGMNQTLENLWAVSQALAIESSGGVVLVYGLQSIKEKDRIKAWLYFVLSALLALTGGIMLFMQLAGWESQQENSPFMLVLFGLRCVVSVGYIYLCRTKHFTFNDLDTPQESAPPTPAQPPAPQPPTIDYQQLARELAPLLQAVRTTIIEEVRASLTTEQAPAAIEARTSASQEHIPAMEEPFLEKRQHQKMSVRKRAPHEDTSARNGAMPTQGESATHQHQETGESATQDERLEQVYQQLRREGKRISGRALAEQAKIHRTTCTNWLKTTHPEQREEPESAINEEERQDHTREATLSSEDGQSEAQVLIRAEESASTDDDIEPGPSEESASTLHNEIQKGGE